MKILYGVQGTGNGHLTRARVMAKVFKQKGVKVDWIFSGREKEKFFDMDDFGNFRVYRGMTFVTEHGRVNFLKTAWHTHIRRFIRDSKSIDVDGYDLIINDFEPVSAWAAKRQNKKVIGISHQNAFFHDIPKKGYNPISSAFMRYFAPINVAIGLHWYPWHPLILPPIVEDTHYKNQFTAKRYLVYLPFSEPEDIVPQLLEFPDYEFYIYQAIKEASDQNNIHLRPFSRDGFQQDLHLSEGVICSAGFELPSECLHLGKKLLVSPLKGQAEQLSNALALQELGYATIADKFDHQTIAKWLKSPSRNPMDFPNVAEAVADWLLTTKGENPEQLHKKLWSKNSVIRVISI